MATKETNQERIDRLSKEKKELWHQIKEHNDPTSSAFQILKEQYAQKKDEIRYLKQII